MEFQYGANFCFQSIILIHAVFR